MLCHSSSEKGRVGCGKQVALWSVSIAFGCCWGLKCLCLWQMWALQDNMKDFVLALQDTRSKINKCPADVSHLGFSGPWSCVLLPLIPLESPVSSLLLCLLSLFVCVFLSSQSLSVFPFLYLSPPPLSFFVCLCVMRACLHMCLCVCIFLLNVLEI